MNYIKHLNGFFDLIIQDPNLNPTHISLYIALFQFWNINRFVNPISITRDEVMRISKISSKATYHKCLRDLNDKAYLQYKPSFNPYKGSMVVLFDFSERLEPDQKLDSTTEKNLLPNGQAMHQQPTSTGTSIEQALVSSINTTNHTNFSNVANLGERTPKNKNEISIFKNEDTEKEKKLREKKKIIPRPTHEEVQAFFLEQKFPELEALKFFHYFSSIGWLVGGKTPMVDWKAAAQNWMLNAVHFHFNSLPGNRAQHLNAGTDKDYAEPL
ncbi:MAG: transcriptional regulator [Flavobacterium sp.]|nr:transcriptional regulator [Flavobacterium sp.]